MTVVECPTCHRSLSEPPSHVSPYARPQVDLLELLRLTKVQTARSAATHLYATPKPNRAEVERARRRLEQLVAADQVVVERGADTSTSVPGDLYRPVNLEPQPGVDLLELLALTKVQTPRSAAGQLFATKTPHPLQIEEAECYLERLVGHGKAVRRKARTAESEPQYAPVATVS